MSLNLPASDSPLRALFDVSDLRDVMALPTFRDAKNSAASYLASESAARSVNALCLRANGEIWLVTFGSRGGWSRRFNFGNPIKRND